jgi:hypothetical protein
MLKWQDPLSDQAESNLQLLASDLRASKPKNWSVVFSKNEVIVRPPDRKIGKFSITVVGEQFCTSFFSRQLNIWNRREHFRVNDTAAAKVKEWMECEIDSPVRPVSE